MGTKIVIQSDTLKNLDDLSVENDLKDVYEIYSVGTLILNGKVINQEFLDFVNKKPSKFALRWESQDLRLYDYLTAKRTPYLNLEDNGTGLPAKRDQLFNLIVPNDGEKEALASQHLPSQSWDRFKLNFSGSTQSVVLEDPNYGWGFWTAIARFPKVVFETRHRDTSDFVSSPTCSRLKN